MRKDDLVAAVAKASKAARGKAAASSSKKGATTKGAPTAKPPKAAGSPRGGGEAKLGQRGRRASLDSKASRKSKRAGTSEAELATASPSSKPPRQRASTASGSDKSTGSKSAGSKSAAKPLAKSSGKGKPPQPATDPQVLKRIRELQLQRQSDKDIAFRPTLVRPPGAVEPVAEKEPMRDRIALFVRDAHWMHATWDITRNAIERARAAMMEQWHGAKPILRLIRMDDNGTTNTAETVERDIEIHGGSRNWYIEWNGEQTSFRVLIGYLSSGGRFHAMAKSNIVKTPSAGSPDVVDEHWADLGAECERIYAISGGYDGELETGELKEMLEDRLHRTLGAPPLAKLGAGADSPFRRRGGFHFDMDVELVVYGSTVPDGYLTLNGEPVKLRSDGSFALRVPFPDRRQVLPAVACSRDGSQQRTIVVAVERNTKIMEPLESEQDTGE